MRKNSEINSQLVFSDRKLIAEISGVPYNTVRKILSEGTSSSRSADTKQGKKVIRAAQIIIKNREAIKKQGI